MSNVEHGIHRARIAQALAALLGLTLWTAAALAHGNHDAELSVDEAKIVAMAHIDSLVAGRKIDGSWVRAEPDEAAMVDRGGQRLWRVLVRNREAARKEEQVLHIYFELGGGFLDAAFAGP